VLEFNPMFMRDKLVGNFVAVSFNDKVTNTTVWWVAKVQRYNSKKGAKRYELVYGDSATVHHEDLSHQAYTTDGRVAGSWHLLRRPPERGGVTSLAFNVHSSVDGAHDKPSYKKAMAGPDAHLWQQACNEEIQSLKANNVYTVVPLQPGIKLLRSQWVLVIKRNSDREVVRYKGRLVVLGNHQQEGIDYDITELSAPVVALVGVRCVIAVATFHGWPMLQLDFDTAYLNAELPEELYMMPPQGYEEYAPDGSSLVWRLNRALYGLKQSAWLWHKQVRGFLKRLGFFPSITAPCIFVSRNAKWGRIIIALYVDDILLTGQDLKELQQVKAAISARYKIKDLGNVHKLLGMRVTRDEDKGETKIDQAGFVSELLERFKMTECNPTDLPATANSQLSKKDSPVDEKDKEFMMDKPYRCLVGSLMWLSIGTRPDIMTITGMLARQSNNPGRDHWTAGKRAIRYVKGTPELGIIYKSADQLGETDLILTGYCDASWADNPENARSTTGFVFMLAGGPVAFRSHLQRSVASSTMEAEYMALYDGAQECELLRDLLRHLGEPQHQPTKIFEDNAACIAVATSTGCISKAARHIKLRYHYNRDLIADGVITVAPIGTKDQLADGLTKNLNKEGLLKVRGKLMG
jgi:hypothetical protein